MKADHRDPVFDEVVGLELMAKKCDACERQIIEHFGIASLTRCTANKSWPKTGRCKWMRVKA